MITKQLTTETLKQMWLEIFFNKQSSVTKISDESVVNAEAFGDARLFQTGLKEIALNESNIFPQYAAGTYLDDAGMLFSSLTRNGQSISSVWLLLIADPGTIYIASSTTFTGSSGIQFQLVDNVTIDDNGYGYAECKSIDSGVRANVGANTITIVSPEPTGHIAVTNEFMAIYGRDYESDEDFRARIKSHPNIIARTTFAYLLEIFRQFDDTILLLQNLGFDENGVFNIGIVKQNLASLTSGELTSLLDSVSPYLATTDINKQGNTINVALNNVDQFIIGGDTTGIDFRCQLQNDYNPDIVRKNIQVALSRFLDPRNWVSNDTIQWTDLLNIVSNVQGMKFVPDNFFYPNTNQIITTNQFPRIKRFVMRDISGNIISDNNGVLTPVFYPNN